MLVGKLRPRPKGLSEKCGQGWNQLSHSSPRPVWASLNSEDGM